MSSAPETRPSLLVRVRDPADRAAWQEFVEIYRPVVLRLARQKGMQAADAEDVAQEVLAAVAKAVEQREHDPARARFSTWLHRVAANAILDAVTRRKPDRGSGDSALQAVLNQQPSPGGPDSDLLRLEYRREVFRWAARQVRKEFRKETWDAFWLTAIEGRPIAAVAQKLARDTGAIYAARSRVIRRIQEKVREYEEEA
jgi:RNA polymerase sigma-70 factor (ECF subfamily)